MSRDLNPEIQFKIRTIKVSQFGIGDYHMYFDVPGLPEQPVMTFHNGAKTFIEPVISELNKALRSGWEAGYEEALRDFPPDKVRVRKDCHHGVLKTGCASCNEQGT